MKVIVFSLDYDGCTAPVYGPTFLQKYVPYYEYNKELCDEITTSSVGADKIILMIGSSRQSANIDKDNIVKCAKKNPPSITSSVFSDAIELADELKTRGLPVEINPFLMGGDTLADIMQRKYVSAIQQFIKTYDHHQNGDHIIQSVNHLCDPFSPESLEHDSQADNPHTFFNANSSFSSDTCKIQLLTEQLRHIASRYLNHDDIIFNFIDDRVDILCSLSNYFKEGAIQDNILSSSSTRIILRLHRYENGAFIQKNCFEKQIVFCQGKSPAENPSKHTVPAKGPRPPLPPRSLPSRVRASSLKPT